MDDDSYKQLQSDLIENPEQGSLIQGTGGVRKTRWALNHGKSGGVRIIYYFINSQGIFFMLLAYPKNKKVSLSSQEKTNLYKLTQQIKEVYSHDQ
ncbi:type II toxin-antitoxin system RelE/ParE family toxin [Psychrobacter lutiphocae]|uniref:type II toxin-antitoxin system RelE/ParE family toxin n=1 Tax=Psychrobacter lutiphocae TaxID=540500 RepID=UPI00037D0A50|nr:type II toxin-antitoxin system RelE/ParE family toxin [Psychrobacter lutiphocae]